jgi:hypothetical protein
MPFCLKGIHCTFIAKVLIMICMSHFTKITAVGIVFTLLVGCSKKSEFERLVVAGTLSAKGRPIPRGIIYFDPDVKKGNRGPQGSALIKDGKFDTRFERSRGCVLGPQIATINACDGTNISSSKPFGNLMFPPFELNIEVVSNGGEINLVVPDSVVALKPSNDSE